MQFRLLIGLLVFSLIAYWLPSGLGWMAAHSAWVPEYSPRWDPLLVFAPYLEYLFAVTMFGVGWLLPRDELHEIAHRWRAVAFGTLLQYSSMPVLAFSAGVLFQLPEALMIGIVMVGCVPGAMASNVLTLTARGNVSYSLCLTTLATLVSPLFVPLLMKLLLQQTREFPAGQVMWQLLWMVVLPTVAGYAARRAVRSWGSRLVPLWSFIAHFTILWIIATVVAGNRQRLSAVPLAIIGALVVLNMAGYAAGWLGAKWGGLPVGMRRALTLEIGMQNAGLGTVLVQSVFPDLPEAQIPTALYTFGCMLSGTVLASFWRRRA